MYGYIEMASMLLDLGATTDLWDLQSGKTALMIAVQHRDISFVRLLLTRGAAVDTPSLPYEEIAGGRTALMIACNVGSIELVDLLLASGANPNARDEANMTPLHYTVPVRGHEPPQVDEPTAMSMASRLLSAGANVSRRDFSGETAADDAMKVEYKELAELLKCPEPPKQRRAHCGLITPGLPCGSDVWRDDTD
jgi:ankyrin repeat protein